MSVQGSLASSGAASRIHEVAPCRRAPKFITNSGPEFEQCFFGQVGSQVHYTWWCEFGAPREITRRRSRHAQHEGARRCGRTCADGDNLDEASRRSDALLPKNHVQTEISINLRLTTLNFYENREKTSGVLSSVRVGTGCCVCMQLRKHLTNVKYHIKHLYVL